MAFFQRFRPAVFACLKHLSVSSLVALICAALVFGVWYPYPYGELVGGRELFLLMILVDVICGPLLTLVVFDPRKARGELIRDIGIIVCLQLSALAYGMNTTIQARPVFLAFERDIFRVVVKPDVDLERLSDAPEGLRNMSLSGPRLIGTRLAAPSDPDYIQSIKLSIDGLHPSFRPGRWLAYDQQRKDVLAKARPLSSLREKHPTKESMINAMITNSHINEKKLGYLPLTAKLRTDWVAIVNLDDAKLEGFLPLDGW